MTKTCCQGIDIDKLLSSDFGTLYTKLNLQPGIVTVIDNFYICPTNKKKIIDKYINDLDEGIECIVVMAGFQIQNSSVFLAHIFPQQTIDFSVKERESITGQSFIKSEEWKAEFQIGFCVLLQQKFKLFMFGIKRVDDAIDFSA
ncbi:hypothetical protein WISP_08311 [Willisornis vidua]|uniref:Uncharacterized protein n=1 Tax=Willisornis vidua TaxID=1566151 RepID=A0ABQ9DXX1_9PASS|nr:hypothetical protein WISP_08311 [Willisornis vidua]